MTLSALRNVMHSIGVAGFSDSPNTFYASAGNGVAPDGSATMSRIVVLSAVRSLSAADQVLFAETADIAADDGWELAWNASQQYQFRISDSGGNVRSVVLAPAQIPDTDELVVLLSSYDGQYLRIHAKGAAAETDLGSAQGYLAAAKKLTIGARDHATEQPALDFNVIAALGTDSDALSAAQMTAIEAQVIDDVEQGRTIGHAEFAVAMEHLFDAQDAIGSGRAKASWVDAIGATTLVKAGEPQGYCVRARF